MIITILKIRTKQFYRLLVELEAVGILLLPVALFICYSIINAIVKSLYLNELCALLLFFLLSVHLHRQDKNFLKLMKVSRIRMYLSEYLLLIFPFALAFLFSHNGYYAGLLLLGTVLITFADITIHLKPSGKTIAFTFIPPELFEWKSGIRKQGLFVAILLVGGIGLSHFLFAVPVVIMLLALTLSMFYMECEQPEWVQVFQLSPSGFLRKKCALHLKLFGFLVLPLVLLFLIFHYPYWYLMIYVSLAAIVLQIFSIIFKYALFIPGEILEGNALFIGLVFISFLVPFLIPVPFLMLLKYYPKSIDNLKEILNLNVKHY